MKRIRSGSTEWLTTGWWALACCFRSTEPRVVARNPVLHMNSVLHLNRGRAASTGESGKHVKLLRVSSSEHQPAGRVVVPAKGWSGSCFNPSRVAGWTHQHSARFPRRAGSQRRHGTLVINKRQQMPQHHPHAQTTPFTRPTPPRRSNVHGTTVPTLLRTEWLRS